VIDKEDGLFAEIANELRKQFRDIYIIGKQLSSEPPRFPAVSIIQENNVVNKRYSTFDEMENVAHITQYIEIYSNDKEQKEEICKSISLAIDNVLKTNGYCRMINQPMVNADDTIARRIMRYKKENETQY
jgi:hypothetical protein